MVYTQIERIKRDINDITHKIHRFEKKGNTQRAYHLSEIRTMLQESLDEIKAAKG